MTENRPILDQIAKELIEKEKINGLELLQIIQDIKPELIPAGSAEKLKEFVGKRVAAEAGGALPEPAIAAAMEKMEQPLSNNTSN